MSSYNSNIVYGSNSNAGIKEIVLRNDTFSKLLQPQIILEYYKLTLEKGQQVIFPSLNKQVSLINISFKNDSKNVAFIFNG